MRFLLTTDTVGGVWTFTKELAGELLRLGYAVALVSFGAEPSPGQRQWVDACQETYAAAFLFRSCDAPLEWMNDNAHAYDEGASLLRGVAESFGAELLHTSQFCFGRLPVPIPRLITAHSDVWTWAQACRPDGLPATPWLAQYRSLVEDGLRIADAVVAPTRWVLDALGTHVALPEKTFVIPNGREIAAPVSSTERKLQAVSAGRLWDEAKGLALLIEKPLPLPLVLAGKAPAPELSSAAHPGLRFTGVLEEKSLLALLQESAIYIAASVYEPFGLAPLEAALCGCAVLAREIPSLREVWGDAALYFNDADELSEQLSHLRDTPALLQQMQQRSLARAQNYTVAKMTHAYLDLYFDLLGAAQTTRSQALEAHAA